MRYAKQIKKSIILIILAIITTLHSSCFLDVFAIDKNNLAEYQGDIQFLSFETLMSFPEKALNDNNSYSTIYDEDKITTQEFENILEELYKNNYILVDIFDIVEKNNLTHKKLYLPQNKKPLVFIFNNATYKSNYQNLGQIDKIIIDRNNNLASYTTKKSIQDRIQHDNEFMLILENFINTHKDFSHNNARGIIFFSGENGILGYNTNSKNTSSKYEKKRVFEVIKKLQNIGWKFGGNIYTYRDENLISQLELAKELSLWNKEIKEIIGDTLLYSFTCKNHNNLPHEKLELLISNGYKIFFENDSNSSINIIKNICFISTKKVCGKSLRENPQTFENLFNSYIVYDHDSRITKYTEDNNLT